MLIAEHELTGGEPDNGVPGPLPTPSLPAWTSHVTVHLPENPRGRGTFRADIDVSTCGLISPLKVLNYLIHSFDSDVVTVDYRVRGFTRDVDGTKHYIDHDINSIQNYLTEDTQNAYQMIDVNVYQENLFHTKMMLKDFNLDNYVFGVNASELDPAEAQSIEDRLRREMLEFSSETSSNSTPD